MYIENKNVLRIEIYLLYSNQIFIISNIYIYHSFMSYAFVNYSSYIFVNFDRNLFQIGYFRCMFIKEYFSFIIL